MKTKLNGFIATLICVFSLAFQSNAQSPPSCSYEVRNPGSCSISVKVEYYDSNGLCNSASSPISGGQVQTFNCSTCSQPLVNVVVTLISIGTASPSGNDQVDVNTTHQQNSIGTGGCSFNSGNYTMDWFYNFTVIGY